RLSLPDALPISAARRQQPGPAHVPGVAGHHAAVAPTVAVRAFAGHGERHPYACGCREPARRRRAGLPGRRSLHARRRSRRGAPGAIPMSQAGRDDTTADDAPLVVFDFDHTLYDGDSGGHLFRWLVLRSWWRVLLGLLVAPVA